MSMIKQQPRPEGFLHFVSWSSSCPLLHLQSPVVSLDCSALEHLSVPRHPAAVKADHLYMELTTLNAAPWQSQGGNKF